MSATLPPAQKRVLKLIQKHPGLSIDELFEIHKKQISSAAIYSAVRELAAKQLITRTKGQKKSHGQRLKISTITQAGEDCLKCKHNRLPTAPANSGDAMRQFLF